MAAAATRKRQDRGFRQLTEDMITSSGGEITKLARKLGVTHATLLAWVSGDSLPSWPNCLAVATYMGRPTGEVLWAAGFNVPMPPTVTTQEVEPNPAAEPTPDNLALFGGEHYPPEVLEEIGRFAVETLRKYQQEQAEKRKRGE